MTQLVIFGAWVFYSTPCWQGKGYLLILCVKDKDKGITVYRSLLGINCLQGSSCFRGVIPGYPGANYSYHYMRVTRDTCILGTGVNFIFTVYVGFNWEPLCKGANLLLDKFYHWETFIGTHRLQMDQMTPPTTFCLASERENLPWQEGTGTLSQRPQRWDPAVDAKHFINKGRFHNTEVQCDYFL